MLNNLISWSIQNRFTVLLLAFILMVAGLYLSSTTNVDVLPEFAPPQVVVETQAPGMVPEQIEALVSIPLESTLSGMPSVKQVRSVSMAGVSVITVIFEFGVDIYRARQLVAEKLQASASRLPPSTKLPTLLPLMPAIGDVLKFGLISDRTSLMELRTLADWEVKNRLLAVPGVARVLIIGGDTREYQVLLDPLKMKSYEVTLNQVTAAVAKTNAIIPGGNLVSEDQQISIQGVARVRDIDDLAETVVAVRDAAPVLLKHVATVAVRPAFKIGDATINGNSGVYVYVTKQPNIDAVKLNADLQTALVSLKTLLPEDVKVIEVFNQSRFIERSINNVIQAIGLGAILVLVVLGLFLFSWRTSIISLVAIPLSIIAALLSLKLTGGSINTMTLGGLAIAVGEVVDDAIIDVENVYRRLRENQNSKNPRPPSIVVYDACVEVRSAVVHATIIVALVFIPVFTMPGITGNIFSPLGFSYVVAIISSLVVALTVTPALCTYLLIRHGSLPEREPPTIKLVKRIYRRILENVRFHPSLVVLSAVMLFISTIFLVPAMGQDLLPQFREDSLIVTVIGRAGQSLESNTRIGAHFEKTMLGRKDVLAVAQWAGRAETDDMAGGPNYSEFDIELKPSDEPLERVLKDVRFHLEEIPGIMFDVGSFISHRVNEVLSGGTRASIAIKVFGPDLNVLRELATEVTEQLQHVRGTVDVRPEPQVVVKRVAIVFDRSKAARYGITSEDFMANVETAFQGRVVSKVLEGQKLFDLKLWFDAPYRHNLDQIRATLIDTPVGMRIPISNVATVEMVEGYSAIIRENVMRRIVVQANASNRDVVSIVEEAKLKIAKNIKLPKGYYIDYAGEYKEHAEASRNLLFTSVLMLIAILFLLRQGLGSWKVTLLVASNLPMAFIGGLIAVALTGNVLTLGSLIGFISLFGISTRNTILLVSRINALQNEGMPFRETVVQGALDRVAPVLMTALTAAFGMLPLAIMGGAGRELEQPLAIVIVGGMFSSTFLTLLVVPALCVLFMRPKPGPAQKEPVEVSV
jgi:CzcA family heavy metal efflux pump